ncbi:ragulator complex protein LAMTOR1 [Pogona vitticeps]
MLQEARVTCPEEGSEGGREPTARRGEGPPVRQSGRRLRLFAAFAMGCCYSSENEASDQGEESKPLLPPASTPPNKSLNGTEPSWSSPPSARTDEQALLSSILAKTAINIIDVSAADQQQMEQHEYMDRARQYSTRLAMLSNGLMHWKKLPPLPSLTHQPHQVLASDPVPFADLQQVSRIAAYAYSALSQIRVDAKEELVVQFGIP